MVKNTLILLFCCGVIFGQVLKGNSLYNIRRVFEDSKCSYALITHKNGTISLKALGRWELENYQVLKIEDSRFFINNKYSFHIINSFNIDLIINDNYVVRLRRVSYGR